MSKTTKFPSDKSNKGDQGKKENKANKANKNSKDKKSAPKGSLPKAKISSPPTVTPIDLSPNNANQQLVLTPQIIVNELNKYIIGQDDAKRAVAVALRNRWRRAQLDPELRQEVKPKNILMIGPTGVGKTEIARRLAKLAQAPFIKVEATKFTEVGYVGRDVESIIRDLVDNAMKQTRESEMLKVQERAKKNAIEKVLDALLPGASPSAATSSSSTEEDEEGKLQRQGGDAENVKNGVDNKEKEEVQESAARKLFRKKLLDGDFDDKDIEIDIGDFSMGIEIMAPHGLEEMTNQLQSMLSSLGSGKKKKRKIKVKKALKQLCDEEAANMLNEEEIRAITLEIVEQHGIVFIDEIDKITQRGGDRSGADVSREGVQRDLLPLVEGCTVSTKYGMVKTDHILFIASGAFHLSKPSDLAPELQGRFPIRVELNSLSVEDFVRILTEPKASLVDQYVALLATEEIVIKFEESAIKKIAEIAYQINERTENIGARRLYTIMEKLLEDISFAAAQRAGETIIIDAAYVNKQLSALVKNEDLSRYIL